MISPVRREVLTGLLAVTGGPAPGQTVQPDAKVTGLLTNFGRAFLTAADAVAAFTKLGVFETLVEAQKANIPAGVSTVRTRWYAESMDFGGATWRRAVIQSPGPGRRSFADGTWWQLAEVNPTPEMFGAPKERTRDCTAALQEAIDFVRQNAASVARQETPPGTANQSFVRLRPRDYLCAELDYTTDGVLVGLGVRGAGPLLSRLVGDSVSGAWPVLDCTGIPSAQLRDFGITCSASSLASCGLLLARDIHAVFHNYQPNLTDVWVAMNPQAPNLVSSIVVQSADMATLTRVFGDRAMGFRAPALVAGRAQGGSSNTIVLDQDDTAPSGAYAGYPIRITSGPGALSGKTAIAGQRNTIVAYDASTRVATVKFPWSVATPTSSSVYEISSVKSRFRDIGGEAWPVRYVNIGGQAYGKRGFIATGAGSYGFNGVYIASAFGGDQHKCAFHLTPCDPFEARPGQMNLDFANTNFENQANLVGGSAVLNQYPGAPVAVRHSGEAEFPNGYVFASNGGGVFSSFEFGGSETGDPSTAAFNLDQAGDVSINGAYSVHTPGTIRGGCKINVANFNWNVRYWDSQWVAFFGAHLAGPASTTAGMIVPRSTVIVPSPVSSSPIAGMNSGAAQIALSMRLAETFQPWAQGVSPVLKLSLKAGLFSPVGAAQALLRSRVSFEMRGSGDIQMYLRQSATRTSIPLTKALSFVRGQAVTFDSSFQNHGPGLGRSTVFGIVNGVTVAHVVNFVPGSYDIAQDGTLEFDVTGPCVLGSVEHWLG